MGCAVLKFKRKTYDITPDSNRVLYIYLKSLKKMGVINEEEFRIIQSAFKGKFVEITPEELLNTIRFFKENNININSFNFETFDDKALNSGDTDLILSVMMLDVLFDIYNILKQKRLKFIHRIIVKTLLDNKRRVC